MNLTAVVQKLKAERHRAEAEAERLDAAIRALGGLNSTATRKGRRQHGHLSAAARHRISLAQKARWRKQKLQTASNKKETRQTRKKHWSQLPENKARVLQLVKRMNRARLAA